MQINLRSGINFDIQTDSDKDVFVDIFVERVYEPALNWTVKKFFGFGNYVLDLGCNTGLFSLFAADYFLKHKLQNFAINGVDASQQALWWYTRRLEQIKGKYGYKHGLIGKLEGEEKFEELDYLAMNRISDQGVSVPYINLYKALPSTPDLIKCDIEGSEGDFIENYKELLQKCKVFVVEFHEAKCDVEKSRDLLFSYGLSCVEKEVTGNVSVETFINAAH